jgi:creatinine amidohydrolase
MTPASPAARGCLARDATWTQLAGCLAAGATAVLPVGAAAKQHGRHLPMGSDWLQAEWLAARLVELAHVAVWPTLSVGWYPAFVRYPGSISLARETFRAVASEVLAGIHRAGATRTLVLNTGISTIEPLQDAIDGLPADGRPRLANVYDGTRFKSAARQLARQRRGSHADEIETSLMLAIAPHRVRMDLAEAWDRKPLRAPFTPDDPGDPGYSPSGVYGDPTLATVSKGRRLLDAMLLDVLGAVKESQRIEG